jgi:hypothetical protein
MQMASNLQVEHLVTADGRRLRVELAGDCSRVIVVRETLAVLGPKGV